MTSQPKHNGVTPLPTENTERVMEHEYDGIREYDNPMPRWWLLTFAATVVFSIIYLFNIGPVGNGKGRVADYEAEMAKQARLHPVVASEVSDEMVRAYMANPSMIADGQKVFAQSCAACHGPSGGGLIGPNLTDEFWLHGGRPSQIHKTIADGVLAKGMPPWAKILKPEQLTAVVVYIASIAGTQPANAKAPQGDRLPP